MSIRGKLQLKELTFRYCRIGGSSRGVMEYIRGGPMVEFAAANPSISVKTLLKPQRHPYIEASYENGRSVNIPLINMSVEEIATRVEHARNSNGSARRKITKFNVAEHGPTPRTTTQGNWTEAVKVKDIQLQLVERSELAL